MKKLIISVIVLVFAVCFILGRNIYVQEKHVNTQYQEKLVECGAQIYIQAQWAEAIADRYVVLWDLRIENALHNSVLETLREIYAEVDDNVDTLIEGKKEIDKMMTQISNPPPQFSNDYLLISDLYDAYNKLYILAIEESGNYYSYSNNVDSAKKAIPLAYDKVVISQPEVAQKVFNWESSGSELLKQFKIDTRVLNASLL